MRNRVILFVITALVIMGLAVGGCAAPSAPAPAAPSTPAAPAASATPEVLKIGVCMATTWPLGLDALHMIEIDAANIAKAGGLDLGGKKYNFQIIFDDNKMDFNLTKTAGQKEIFQDKVDFIISDPWSLPLIQLCEENKIPGFLTNYDVETHDPKLNWVVGGSNGTTTYPAFINWVAEKHPNLKTMVGVYPDRHDGRLSGEAQRYFAKVAGLQVLDMIYYPPSATDLSAVGTKIKTLNPDILVPYGGGPPLDAGAMKAAWTGGWKGKVAGIATMPGSVVMAIAGKDAVEGGDFIAWPAEFEPATTPEAKQFKADYIAKYGKWDDPEYTEDIVYYGLKGALITAKSADKAKVMQAAYGGYTYVCPMGTLARFQRLDQNNTKFTDAVFGNLPAKTIEGGKIRQIDTISVEQQLKYMKAVYGAPWK